MEGNIAHPCKKISDRIEGHWFDHRVSFSPWLRVKSIAFLGSTGRILAQGETQDRKRIPWGPYLTAGDGDSDGIAGGNYVLGDDETDNFFALYGDTNGDRLVGVSEFGEFRSSFGKLSTEVGFNPLFDFDNNGVVGVSDFGEFRSRFGKPKFAW